MTTIENVTTALETLFGSARKPAAVIPVMTILCGTMQRPGLSSIRSIANIAKALTSSGIQTSQGPDGSDNKTLKFARAIVDEVYRAIMLDAKIEGGIMPGGITVTTTGANAGGPVVSTGVNVNPVSLTCVPH